MKPHVTPASMSTCWDRLTDRRPPTRAPRGRGLPRGTSRRSAPTSPGPGQPPPPLPPSPEHRGSPERGRRPPAKPRRMRIEDLLGGGRELIIEHRNEEYRLRMTSNSKLILTK